MVLTTRIKKHNVVESNKSLRTAEFGQVTCGVVCEALNMVVQNIGNHWSRHLFDFCFVKFTKRARSLNIQKYAFSCCQCSHFLCGRGAKMTRKSCAGARAKETQTQPWNDEHLKHEHSTLRVT